MKVSFEFSPPKTEAAERTLWETIERLTPLRPTFFSVTYGAGGSTRQRTHETVARIKKETGIDAAAHLTCVAATQGEINDVARAYWDAGIRHIVALRGDPPAGMGGKYCPHPGGYENAAALVAGHGGGDHAAGFDVVVEALEQAGEPGRYLGAAQACHLQYALEVRHRHDARHHRHVDAGRRRLVAEAQEVVGLEEELGDAAVSAGIDLALEVLQVGLGVR